MGADVTLISGPTAQKVPFGISFVSTYSAKSMYDAVIQNFEKSDIIIMAAAVADYKPKNISSSKIKKSDEDLYLELERTEDILCKIGNMKDKRIVVGFAAETDNLVENAKTKIEKKNLDAIVLNDVKENGAGFGTDTNTIKIIKRNGEITDFPNMSKVNAAFNIMNMINTLKR
jgi:phosphopantothenoylcysteine decarboxylase/phosphopantothenate--cysteine ligase